MSIVTTGLSISLDGFIAGANDGNPQPLGDDGARLFDWFSSADTPSRLYDGFRMSKPSAEVFDAGATRVGVVISGRRTYDISNAWGGTGAARSGSSALRPPRHRDQARMHPGDGGARRSHAQHHLGSLS